MVMRAIEQKQSPLARMWKRQGEAVTQWIMIVGLFAGVIGLEKIFAHGPLICRIDSAAPSVAADSDVSMTVRQGMACPVWVRTGAAAVDELKIVSLPHKGTVVQRGRTGVTYRPGRNVQGEDFFAFELRGRSPTRAFDSLVKVAVRVE